MSKGPVLNQPKSGPGSDLAGQRSTIEGERRLLTLILRMKVWNAMLAVKHADYDSEEVRNDRHGLILPRAGFIWWQATANTSTTHPPQSSS
jgi:hypothetical protein